MLSTALPEGESRDPKEILRSNVQFEFGHSGQPGSKQSSSVAGSPRPVGRMGAGLTCSYCGVSGITRMSKLALHIDRMHRSAYTCTICKVELLICIIITYIVQIVIICAQLTVVHLRKRERGGWKDI